MATSLSPRPRPTAPGPAATPTRHRRLLILVLALVGAVGASTFPATADGGDAIRWRYVLAPGVEVFGADGVRGPSGTNPATGPVAYHVVRVHPQADVRLTSVVSNDAVGHGRETVRSMCERVGGIACVNASFALSPSSVEPYGGIVVDGRLVQSSTPIQYQLTVRNGALSIEDWSWSARLEGTRWGRPTILGISGVNTSPAPGEIALRTPDWGPTTRTPAGGTDVVIGTPGALPVGSVRQPIQIRSMSRAGDTPIPRDGAVLSATAGPTADFLWTWAGLNQPFDVSLLVESPPDIQAGWSGHPILLRDGAPAPLDPADAKVTRRHPRTLLGWDGAGNVWMVVVDGRQAHTQGMDLYEATRLLQSLGATWGVNLDGGGSSTLSAWCGADRGWCGLNSPSDGVERAVWVAIAVVAA